MTDVVSVACVVDVTLVANVEGWPVPIVMPLKEFFQSVGKITAAGSSDHVDASDLKFDAESLITYWLHGGDLNLLKKLDDAKPTLTTMLSAISMMAADLQANLADG